MWRLCRDAWESEACHLGMWSVGRGEENRLLFANMSKVFGEVQTVRRSELGIGHQSTLQNVSDGEFWNRLEHSTSPVT